MEGLEVNFSKLGISGITSAGGSNYFREVANPKIEEIKKLLDGKSNREKLEGMKRLIASISKGRDVSALFPDVVKNVITQNVELKKLVYIYLVHYAESQSETALLAINTFQKGLENKNQLIRALALRVMSSIRVRLISNLVVMAIKNGARDSSPYVRKTAAHAIPKVFSQDQDQKEVLTEIIQDLLGDKQTTVLGSVVCAFTEVCPERLDLIHPHFRKLCNLLADIEEWGQIAILNLLTRYGRSQFVNPDPEKDHKDKPKKAKKAGEFYSDSESDSDSSSDSELDWNTDDFQMDPDHRLLLRCAQPLLQSRNNGVVMAVASLYYYLAPPMEAQKVGKSLVRILRNQREVAYVVLTNIASMASKRPEMFSPYLSEFFVSATDPGFCRELKLEILTYLASENSIHKILRELQNYVHREDKAFVTATVQAIGRCALRVPAVMDTCMHGLMALMKGKNENVVAESVIAIKKLLQTGTTEHDSVISHFAKQIDTIKNPEARASILWVIGEYCEKIPLLAPDVLRKLAKSFPDEDVIVKLQILNLGSKLHLTNPEQTSLLFQYVLTMAKYDSNYDIRDKARVMRTIFFTDGAPNLSSRSKELFHSKKPIPQNKSPSEERLRWGLGSLSALVKHTAYGYQAIPDYPEVAPDPSVRNVVVIGGKPTDQKNFYESDSDYDSDGSYDRSYDSDDSYSRSRSRSRSYSRSRSRSRSWSSSRSRSRSRSSSYSRSRSRSRSYSRSRSRSPSDDDRNYNSDSDRSYSSDSDSERRKKKSSSKKKVATKKKEAKAQQPPSPVMQLQTKKTFVVRGQPKATPVAQPAKQAQPTQKNLVDDFLDFGSSTPLAPSTASAPLALDDLSAGFGDTSSIPAASVSGLSPLSVQLPRVVLLNPVTAGGLAIEYSFLRTPSMYGDKYIAIQLVLRNTSAATISNVKIGKLMLEQGTELVSFPEISYMAPGSSVDTLLHVAFGSLNQPAKFEVWHGTGKYSASLPPAVGELVRGSTISPQDFASLQKKLSGLHEAEASFVLREASEQVSRVAGVILENANVNPVSVDEEAGKFQFSGRSVLDSKPVLVSVTLDLQSGKGRCKVNCENAILGSTLANALKNSLLKL